MPRALDHIVHAVDDLDGAAEFYRKLGFTVGARDRHSWGTHNCLVQLEGFFIEILTVAEPDLLERDAEHAALARHFGIFQRDALSRGQGLSMLILQSDDVAGDAMAFARAGIGRSAELTFSRQGRQGDGAVVTVGFSLAFVGDPMSPDTGFAVTRQHNPNRFWSKTLQAHANSAHAVHGVVLAADNPTDHHIFIEAFTGQRELHSTSIGLLAQTPRGAIEVVEPVAFADRFGVTPAVDGDAMTLSALRIGVLWGRRIEDHLKGNGIPFERRGNAWVVKPDAAFGTTLVFEAETD
jgi:catechol 2,3-dioxygenase-like lactoylglutathione lyase family enzyme